MSRRLTSQPARRYLTILISSAVLSVAMKSVAERVPGFSASPGATMQVTATQKRGKYNGKIVFVSNRHNEALSIWTMNPDGGSLTRLTDEKSRTEWLPSFVQVYDVGPVWSPDGARIAFVSNRDSDFAVYIMSADGKSVNLVTDKVLNPASVAWSPSGNKIALSGGVRVVPGIEKPSVHVYVVNIDGSQLSKLTSDGDYGNNNDSPTWSPDGKQIAFSSNRDPDGKYKIWVMNADGSNQRRLTDIHGTSNPLFYGDSGPAWSPDGSKILFGGYRDFNGTRNCFVVNCSELFVMNADGSNDVPLTNDPNRNGGYAASWSPDGTKIVASRSLGTIAERNSINRGTAIIVMNADGSNEVNISNRGTYDFNGRGHLFVEGSPDWQPLAAPPNFAPSVVGFSAPSYVVYEDEGSVRISVMRTHNLNELASCVYATLDGHSHRADGLCARFGYVALRCW